MPEMDGYEATEYIRNTLNMIELPVIAMTANAMAGDKEKALEAGMNDHVAKPINVKQLFSALAQHVKLKNPGVSKQVINEVNEQEIQMPKLPGVDVQAGIARLQGNKKLYLNLLKKFRQSQHNFVEQFDEARTDDDKQATTRCAHTLKGVAGNIGAAAIQESASQLEDACNNNLDDSEVQTILERLSGQLRDVIQSISKLELPSAGSDSAPMDAALLREKVSSLLSLLKDDDTEAGDLVEEILQTSLESDIRIEFEKLAELIGAYDFDEAVEKLAIIMNKLFD